jgi:hypothetical protein
MPDDQLRAELAALFEARDRDDVAPTISALHAVLDRYQRQPVACRLLRQAIRQFRTLSPQRSGHLVGHRSSASQGRRERTPSSSGAGVGAGTRGW